MRRQNPQSCGSRLHITERQIAFPTHPFDPPSSPPPTSPLPPLPEIALNSNHGSPVSTMSPISPITGMNNPIRPPRPQTSLPNLQPRTITSPEISKQGRHSTVLTPTILSPNPPSRRWRDSPIGSPSLKAARNHRVARSIRRVAETKPQDSVDVLGALPKLFNKFSDPQSSHTDAVRRRSSAGNIGLLQISQAELSKSRMKTLKRRKKTRKPVARSALFIPGTPPEDVPIDSVSHARDLLRTGDTRNILPYTTKCQSIRQTPEPVSSPVLMGECTSRRSHKRSHAVTSFAFNFEQSQDSALSSASRENLTSLPRIPSEPILFVAPVTEKKNAKKRSHPVPLIARSDSDEAITFAVLPYAHTMQFAGPIPMTEKDNQVRFDTKCDIEAGEEQVRHLTEEEIRAENRKRILWAIATVMLVIAATTGILVGIVWKLRSFT